MMIPARLPTLLFDPRGRMSRGELLVSAAAVVSIEAALAVLGPVDGLAGVAVWPVKGCALWIGVAALVKRLHDLGRSGWWALAGAGALCIWTTLLTAAFLLLFGPDAFAPGSLGMTAIFGLVMLPAIGFTLWLHVAAGEALTNRFGAPHASPGQFAPRPPTAA